MPLLNLIIYLVVIGVILWLINTYVPMAGSIKTILNVVVIIAVLLWLVNASGLLAATSVHQLRAP